MASRELSMLASARRLASHTLHRQIPRQARARLVFCTPSGDLSRVDSISSIARTHHGYLPFPYVLPPSLNLVMHP